MHQHPQYHCAVHCLRQPSSIRQHTSAYVSIRQHTSAYVSIRQHTSAYVSILHIIARCTASASRPAYVSIRRHTSAYVSIRQHTSAYVSIRQHTSAYVSQPRQRQSLQQRKSLEGPIKAQLRLY
jgi:hypothetical protein